MSITKKIRILCEGAYAETIWCKRLISGLEKELKKRRLVYEETVAVDEIGSDAYVFVLGMSKKWIEQTISKCNETGIVPIVLSSQSKGTIAGQCHLICPDIEDAAKGLKDAFSRAGRTKIALYASNRTVDLDRDRTEIFSQLIRRVEDIYPNTGSLEKCFRLFVPKAAAYDAVICTNGYAAVSLVKKLEKETPALLEKLVIVSCEEVLKHSKYNQWISLIELNLEDYGRTALQLIDILSQRDDISNITVEMKCSVCEIPAKSEEAECANEEEGAEVFEDPEIIHMAKIEQLLRDADDLDHHIIAMLLSNAKYSDIADSCYMTEGNVKYRVKKYMTVCECKTKKELLELLQEYLQ